MIKYIETVRVDLKSSVTILLILLQASSFPHEGLNPCLPALGAQSLSHWTTREVPRHMF